MLNKPSTWYQQYDTDEYTVTLMRDAEGCRIVIDSDELEGEINLLLTLRRDIEPADLRAMAEGVFKYLKGVV